jgi:diacylglycerol kinase family enzyme
VKAKQQPDLPGDTLKVPFTRCVIILNPASTHSQRALRLVDELRVYFNESQLTVVETSPAGYMANKKLIVEVSRELDERSLICVGGGDGTANMVINILLTASEVAEPARHATLLPLWGGNANDLAYMANGLAARTSMKTVLTRGSIAAVYPLAVELRRNDRIQTKLAACYVSFGASAHAARLLNHKSHRQKRIYRLAGARLLVEVVSIIRVFMQAERFACEINGTSRRVYDLIAINGSRIAKVNRIPVNITDKVFYEVMVPDKDPMLVNHAIRVLHGLLFKRNLKTKQMFVVRQVTWTQLDGEAMQIAENTEISVKHYDRPFYILGTRFNRKA